MIVDSDGNAIGKILEHGNDPKDNQTTNFIDRLIARGFA